MVIRNSNRAWLVGAALGCLVPTGIGAQPSPSDRVLAAVDVVITQSVVNADGSSPWPVQAPTAFTLQKLRTAAGLTKIVLAYRATSAAARTPALSHPLDGARAEYDPSTGALSVFDRGGTRRNPRLSLDRPSPAPIGSPAEWLDTLVLTAAATPARRRELERSYGQVAGSAGRLHRYVLNGDGVSEEVLVDPGWAVPVEITVRRQEAREGHITFEYGSTPSGNLFRQTVRTERVIDPAAGRRSVLAVQFSNVRAEGW